MKQSLSKVLKSFSGWLDNFDMSLGKSVKSRQSPNNRLSIIHSTENKWRSVLHKLRWASSVLPELTHTVLWQRDVSVFWLVRSCIAAWYLRNLKELFWCTCHQCTVHSHQQITLPRVVNEERYEWSNVVNAEALAYQSLMCCFLNINDIHDLFATSFYGNSWWPCYPDAFIEDMKMLLAQQQYN